MDPVITQHDYETLAEFRAALRRFLSFSEAAALQAGMTPRQHQALLAIKGASAGEEVSVRDLADRLCLHHNSTVELANRLVKAGLVVRVHDQVDRRRVWLRLTPEGEARLAALSAIHLEELRRIRPVLHRVLTRGDDR